MYCPLLLEQISKVLKEMFNVGSCPIIFVSGIKARGNYYFRSNKIEVSLDQSLAQIVECILHEIVHYKQHMHKKLQCVGQNHFIYNGITYINTPYEEQPWEKEANYYMARMFSKFARVGPKELIKEIIEVDSRRNKRIPQL